MRVLAARGKTEARIEGLEAGAEDYLPKPFEVTELLARVRALLRRHRDQASVLALGNGFLDLATRTVRGMGRPA